MLRAHAFLTVLLTVGLQLGAGPSHSGWAAQPEELPIIDLHLHLDPTWDLQDMLTVLDRLGVARAGQGPRGPDSIAIDFAARSGGRIIPVAGVTLPPT